MSYNKIVESGIYALVLCHLSGYTDTKALAYYIHYLYIMTLVMANILIYDANEYDATMSHDAFMQHQAAFIRRKHNA